MIKLEKWILRCIGYLIAALIGLMMIDISAAVVVRYILHTSLSFAEELGRYLFVWIVFLGMAYCVGTGKHVSLDLMERALKEAKKKILQTVIYGLCFLFFTAMTKAGFVMCMLGGRQKSATMRIPMNYIYLCIPITGILCMVFLLIQIYRLWKKKGGEELAPFDDGKGAMVE